jgi:hypothetical protein
MTEDIPVSRILQGVGCQMHEYKVSQRIKFGQSAWVTGLPALIVL